jgi:hypothetical protein
VKYTKIAGIGLLAGSLLFLSACGSDAPAEKETITKEKMQAVCQLAAVECFYHNTTKLKKEDTVLWWDTCTELWVESSGIVKMGVDLDDVDLTVNKKKVTVTLPEVKVLECKVDEASLDGDSYHAKTTGLGAKKPDAAMETEAFSEAVKHITNMAEEDEATKKIVERRVKKLLSQYIENMGKIQKIQYDIEWKTKEKDTQN